MSTLKLAPRIQYQPTNGSTWIISDGSQSAEKEGIALAKALTLPWVIKRVQWRKGLQWLPMPFKKLFMDYHHVTNRKPSASLPWFLEGDSLNDPYPNFVIGSGPKTIPGVLHVSRKSGRASFSAFIHFPNLPFVHFDQVFLQKHEIVVQLAALGMMKDQKNYFRINTTLNTITPKSLQQSKLLLQKSGLIPDLFWTLSSSSSSSSPIVTILMGGPNEDCSHNTDRMVNRIKRLLQVQNARVLISYSQRTANNTKLAMEDLRKSIQIPENLFIYDPLIARKTTKAAVVDTTTKGESQITNAEIYEGMLALADKIVVTADSVAMTNEALATGKPVYILGGELARGKLKVFHRTLADERFTRAFRPGRVLITSIDHNNNNNEDAATTAYAYNDNDRRADPLSYPGDHPPWNKSLAFKGPTECKKVADRLSIMRDCRIEGRRVPQEILDATC
ncbi:hypothetical protein BG004_000396 [Podila humilis]|nr:hypothetical protein BG004_000396 [Podila humilis]